MEWCFSEKKRRVAEMALLASTLLTVALGTCLLYRFTNLTTVGPRWAGWLLMVGGGSALGISITSVLFLGCVCVFPDYPHLPLFVRLFLLVVCAFDCWRVRTYQVHLRGISRGPFGPLLAWTFAAGLLLATYGTSRAWMRIPHGNWDAWMIWNLRAKFLAAGDGLVSRAWSGTVHSHTEYPLLLSGYVANCWMDVGNTSPVVPMATSFLFFLALLCTVTGGIAVLRGSVLGLLAGICLMGIPPLLSEVPAQYSDVPLACFFACAVVFALLDCPVISGIAAGSAAWTKDEGLLFLAVICVFIAILKRSTLPRFCYGAAPFVAILLVFKFVIARGAASSLLALSRVGLASKVIDLSRYELIARRMAREILNWRLGWYHPGLPLIILIVGLGINRRHLRDVLFPGSIAAALVLGYFGIYVITSSPLEWHLQTSLTRLFVQVSPIILLSVFTAIKVPEPIAPTPALEHSLKALV